MSTVIIAGHYGSGKSEFAANLALWERERGREVTVADIDIVNPYFRTRQLEKLFEENGIRVLSSNFKNEYNLDTPALDPGIQECFLPGERLCIIDVGGDAVGARALARFASVAAKGCEMWLTVNANRPMTDSVEKIEEFSRAVEEASRFRVTGLVNTTHMLRDTTTDDVIKGNKLAREASYKLAVPLIFNAVPQELVSKLKKCGLEGEIMPIKMLLREGWQT